MIRQYLKKDKSRIIDLLRLNTPKYFDASEESDLVNYLENEVEEYFVYEDNFEIILNSGLGKWGAFEPDHSLDILKTMVPVEKTNNSVEQFTIRFEEGGATVYVVCEWSDTQIKIPIDTEKN